VSDPDSAQLDLDLSEGALIAGWRFGADGTADEIGVDGIGPALADPAQVVWLHFNLANARAAHALETWPRLPAQARAALAARRRSASAAGCGNGLLVAMSDVAYDAQLDLDEPTTLWIWADERLAVTGRVHPTCSAEALRQSVREGETIDSGYGVPARLYELRAGLMQERVEDLGEQLAKAEDRVLEAGVTEQREELGRMRLLAGRIRRHVTSDRIVLERLLARPPSALPAAALERFARIGAELSHLNNEIAELHERAHLLQGELASRVAEDTNRRMAVLTTVSVVLMPMTVATGLWGINTGGVPGAENESGFGWVSLLVLLAGGVTLWLLRRFRLL
jgi:zinc transporter